MKSASAWCMCRQRLLQQILQLVVGHLLQEDVHRPLYVAVLSLLTYAPMERANELLEIDIYQLLPELKLLLLLELRLRLLLPQPLRQLLPLSIKLVLFAVELLQLLLLLPVPLVLFLLLPFHFFEFLLVH